MSNPTPIYLVKFASTTLLGYAIDEDIPLAMRLAATAIIGSDGGGLAARGADFRSFRIGMRILSRLSSGSGLAHLDDCKNQWRTNLATLSRTAGPAALYIGETDRYIMCEFENSSAPLSAGSSRAISFSLTFRGNPPWFLGTEVSSTTGVGGDTSISVVIGDTRKTYPTITIPSGITRITLSHTPTGKSFTLSGSHASPLIVDCATLQITQAGSNALSYLTSNPDFGIYRVGSGTMTLNATAVTGSGSVILAMTPRFER